ncbi:N-carbamoylsarcosine amidase [Pigmentiphaga sp. NML080357]|uniref:isochorismatase family protein n=1 Tax=Pigmentiphaga sp. NML080357 TaxID=2008675 RepID=UPI000B40EC95|nr:isochorismatase family protein [Pigmentiphaga sp. NML080357]OVZ57995.1 N-carbamoylsarcosine amidase [Pigmentiphaga sp. NML080357]
MSEIDVYRRQGLGKRSGLGHRCGLVLVDFVNGFVDPALLGGQHVADAAERTLPVLRAFRRLGLPVAHSRVVFADDGSDHNVFCRKAPALTRFTEAAGCSQILPLLAPEPGERIVRKQSASAFFATSLADWLRARGVDTVVVVGCTTSGCVRATAVDAMQHDFMTVVVEDCVGDRALGPHQASLFDLRQKYADVMGRDALLAAIS